MNATRHTATIEHIYLAARAGESPRPIPHARALAGHGLEGDRYAAAAGRWSRFPDQTGAHITLIAAEDLDAIAAHTGIDLHAGQHRRNIVTRGADLHALVGHHFRIGDVLLVGVRLCLPCRYLDEKAGPGTRAALMNHGKGGLRAEILTDGIIRVGDTIIAEENRTT